MVIVQRKKMEHRNLIKNKFNIDNGERFWRKTKTIENGYATEKNIVNLLTKGIFTGKKRKLINIADQKIKICERQRF